MQQEIKNAFQQSIDHIFGNDQCDDSRVGASSRICVAVSGGSDSLALLELFCESEFNNLCVASVDHGLRENSAQEIQLVRNFCELRGVEHRAIQVEVSPKGNISANARSVRYEALEKLAVEFEAEYLAVGHTLDDQVETFFLNAFRGSGLSGLTAMPVEKKVSGLKLIRPMLGIRRKSLQEYLLSKHIEWCSDPSNVDPKYDRVKIRKLLHEFEDNTFSLKRIGKTIANLQNEREVVELSVRSAFKEVAFWKMEGVELGISRALFEALPNATQFYMIAEIAKYFGRSQYRARQENIEGFLNKLKFTREGGDTFMRSFFRWNSSEITVCAEFANIEWKSFDRWHLWEIAPNRETHFEIKAAGDNVGEIYEWRTLGISFEAAKTLPTRNFALERNATSISGGCASFSGLKDFNLREKFGFELRDSE